MRVLTDPDIPPSAGAYRPIEIVAPEGSILNAPIPTRAGGGGDRPAVAAGNVETSSRVADLVLAAFGRAQGQGTMNNLTLGAPAETPIRDGPAREGPSEARDGPAHVGPGEARDGPAREGPGEARDGPAREGPHEARDGRAHAEPGEGRDDGFSYYETSAAARAHAPDADGPSGVHVAMSNTLNTPIEALEREFPVRVIEYALRRGSGGAGRIAAATGSCASSRRCAR